MPYTDDIVDIQDIKKKVVGLFLLSKEDRLNQIQLLTLDQLKLYCRVLKNLKKEFSQTRDTGAELVKQDITKQARSKRGEYTIQSTIEYDGYQFYNEYRSFGYGFLYDYHGSDDSRNVKMTPFPSPRQFHDLLFELERQRSRLKKVEKNLVTNICLRSLIKNAGKNESEVKNPEQTIQEIQELILADQEEKALNALLDRHTLIDRCQTLDAANKDKEEKIKQLSEEKDREIEQLKSLLEFSQNEQRALKQDITVLQRQLVEAGKKTDEHLKEENTALLLQQDLSKKLQVIESDLTETKKQVIEISAQSLDDLLKKHQPKSVMSFFSLSEDVAYINLKALLTKASKQVSISEVEACIRYDARLLQLFQDPDLPCEKTEKTALVKDLAKYFKQAASCEKHHILNRHTS